MHRVREPVSEFSKHYSGPLSTGLHNLTVTNANSEPAWFDLDMVMVSTWRPSDDIQSNSPGVVTNSIGSTPLISRLSSSVSNARVSSYSPVHRSIPCPVSSLRLRGPRETSTSPIPSTDGLHSKQSPRLFFTIAYLLHPEISTYRQLTPDRIATRHTHESRKEALFVELDGPSTRVDSKPQVSDLHLWLLEAFG